MAYALAIGNKLIRDILNPVPEDIDLQELWPRLSVTRRFSNNPDALTVLQHVHLVRLLADKMGMPGYVQWWCLHHDDHEAIITDIPGPLKALISQTTDVLMRVEARLDEAICLLHGEEPPTDALRRVVHVFDKLAETLEWRFVLGYPAETWNLELPFDDDTCRHLILLAVDHAEKACPPRERTPLVKVLGAQSVPPSK